MSEVKKDVFLSYGHDIIPLARRIRDDLKRLHNIEAWFDENDIRSSNKWDEAIEKGILECNFFLALMTSHGFRKPNGVCLNEVVYATNNAKPLITIKLEKIPIPLLLCRIQYIDVTDAYNTQTDSFNEELYQELFDKIVFCINNPEIEYENKENYILHFLNPQDNTYDLAGNLQGYYHREWLEDDFYSFLKSNDSIYLLTGYPGTGKSTFSSYLAMNCEEVKGIHFCRYDNLRSTKFTSIVKTLCYHLCTQFDEFASEISKLDLLNIDKGEDYLFEELFKKPLQAIKEKDNDTVCLVVDGIDEMPLTEAKKVITNFESAAKSFPSFLKILFTSRHNQNIIKLFAHTEPHLINVTKDKCVDDVLKYLKERYKKGGLDEEEMMEIAKNSDGIFQYVISICKDIDEGKYDKDAPLPVGISKLYEHQFTTRFSHESFMSCSPFLELVLASYEPLDTRFIREIIGKEKYDECVTKFGDYIAIQGGKVRIIHKSLADYLITDEGSSFTIDVSEGHKLLVDYL